MGISSSDILNIEEYYSVKLPESLRIILILIGEKLINTAIERSLRKKFSSAYDIKDRKFYSVYDIQDMMLKSIKCVDDYDISSEEEVGWAVPTNHQSRSINN